MWRVLDASGKGPGLVPLQQTKLLRALACLTTTSFPNRLVSLPKPGIRAL